MHLLPLALQLALASTTLAYPGMEKLLGELYRRQENDTGDGAGDGDGDGAGEEDGHDQFDSNELIGDLLTLTPDQLSPVGQSVMNIILGNEDPQSDVTWAGPVPALGTPECEADVCCVWQYIADELVPAFKGESGRCTGLARGAIRLGFHDAGGFSKATAPGGGADASILLAPEEMLRSENHGLEQIAAQIQGWYGKWQSFNISLADMIQFAAQLAVVTCPLGPRSRTFIGRVDNSSAAPEGLLPPVDGEADFLIELFRNKTIAPHGLTALVGAHTTSQQFFVDLDRVGDPQDSTPGVWDVLFYSEVLNQTAVPPRVFLFPSDINLSKANETVSEWVGFANDGQEDWNEDYAREYIRLSLLSVYGINNMTECTKVLPPAITTFQEDDSKLLRIWRNTTVGLPDVAQAVFNGSLVTISDFQNVSDSG